MNFMKDLIISKIDTAIKKLRNAKLWLNDPAGDVEENLLGVVEDNLDEAASYIDSAIYDVGLFMQSMPNNEQKVQVSDTTDDDSSNADD
jgi:hypothetical protein